VRNPARFLATCVRNRQQGYPPRFISKELGGRDALSKLSSFAAAIHALAEDFPANFVQPPRPLPRALRLFVAVDLALLVLASTCELISRFVLHLGDPYNSPLLHEYFPDVVDMRPRYDFYHSLRFFTDTQHPPCMYPATTAALYKLLYFFRPYDLAAFFIIAVAIVLAASILFTRELIRRGLNRSHAIALMAMVVVTSFPLWFELKQANVEIVVWLLLTLGLYCFFRDPDLTGFSGYAAAACFGIAAAMKVYPLLYLALFLPRRPFRQSAKALATGLAAALAVAIPAQWLEYSHLLESWRLSSEQMASYRYIISLKQLLNAGFDHSLFGLIKASFRHRLPPTETLDHMLTAYMVIAAIAVVAVWFLRIHHLPVTNQVLCISILTILLPPTSFDYSLIHLYPAWALLTFLALKSTSNSQSTPGLTASFICLAILFSPESEFILHSHVYGGQFKGLALIALFFIALKYPFAQIDLAPEVAGG